MESLHDDYPGGQEAYIHFNNTMKAYSTKDANVRKVIHMLSTRADTGYKKYGVTTERTDIDLLGWLQHLQEELLDASIYIERLKGELPK